MSTNVTASQAETLDNSIWSVIREGLKGSTRDFTAGPIWVALVILAIPMILEMSMESIFAVVDIFFVGRLGADAVAIVGLTESVMALIYAVAFGLTIGATATVARRIGEKDDEGAAKTAAHVLYLGVIVSLIMSTIGIIFAPMILRLLGAEPHVIVEGAVFMRIMLGGNAVVVFIFLLNAIFRGAGDAAIAMRVLVLANVLNMILSPLFYLRRLVLSRARGNGRGGRHHDRAGLRRALCRLEPVSARRPDTRPPRELAARSYPAMEIDQALGDRHFPAAGSDGELDRVDAHNGGIWKCGDRRLCHRAAGGDVCAASRVGPEQRGGHHGRAKFGRGPAGAFRKGRVDRERF